MIDRKILANLIPINALSVEHLQRLAETTDAERFEVGSTLFSQGEEDRRTVYLLKGEVTLGSDGRLLKTVQGGTEDTRHPLAPYQPRQVTAEASSDVVCVRLQSEMVDALLTWDQSRGYIVDELHADEDDDDSDWMTRILQKELFFRIPPPNIQAMFQRMQPVSARAGARIIEQGAEGDFYYIIKRGQCQVTRRTRSHPEGIALATLGVGDGFGEDALISDARRNATVTMLDDGELMRLSKTDFMQLLNEPLLDWVGYDDGQEMVRQGARWLDVRLPAEYASHHLAGSLNIPYHALRMRAANLDPETDYLLYCDTGSRSSAAAYVLSERGFRAYVLRGGLNGAAP